MAAVCVYCASSTRIADAYVDVAAEVGTALAPALPAPLRPLLAFEVGPHAVGQIASKLIAWLELDAAERAAARAALAAEAARRYSWESVAEGVIAAARGELDRLPHPAS